MTAWEVIKQHVRQTDPELAADLEYVQPYLKLKLEISSKEPNEFALKQFKDSLERGIEISYGFPGIVRVYEKTHS